MLLVCALGAAAAVSGADLHRLWDDRCQQCHGHAGEFARHFLTVVDGTVYGRRPERDLRQFLDNHYLAGGEVERVYAMLLAQARTGGEFQTKCSGCHGSAAQFARNSLELREGVVYGRKSGRPVAEFLPRHMSLSTDETAFFLQLLERVTGEVQND